MRVIATVGLLLAQACASHRHSQHEPLVFGFAWNPLEQWIGGALILVLLWRIFLWEEELLSLETARLFWQVLTPARVGMFALALVHLRMVVFLGSASFVLKLLGFIALLAVVMGPLLSPYGYYPIGILVVLVVWGFITGVVHWLLYPGG